MTDSDPRVSPFDVVPENHHKWVDPSPSVRGVTVGVFKPRVWSRPAKQFTQGTRDPYLLIKCGCCDEKVTIDYDEASLELEINGVSATVEDWRDVLLPLLGFKRESNGEWEDVR